MTATTDTMFDDILSSAAPALPEDVAARLRASVLAEVRVEARPIRQRWFARVAAVAVATTTILSGASYAVAAAKPGEPLYPARQAMVRMGSAVAGTVTQVLHMTPSPGSTGGGSAAPGSTTPDGVGHPSTGISTSTPMPRSGPQGPGMHGPGSTPRGGGKPSAGSTSGPSMGGASGGTSGGSGGGGSKMGPTAPSGMSGTSGGSGAGNGSVTGSMGDSQPRPGGMTAPGGAAHR